jgi:hypothetical protein
MSHGRPKVYYDEQPMPRLRGLKESGGHVCFDWLYGTFTDTDDGVSVPILRREPPTLHFVYNEPVGNWKNELAWNTNTDVVSMTRYQGPYFVETRILKPAEIPPASPTAAVGPKYNIVADDAAQYLTVANYANVGKTMVFRGRKWMTATPSQHKALVGSSGSHGRWTRLMNPHETRVVNATGTENYPIKQIAHNAAILAVLRAWDGRGKVGIMIAGNIMRPGGATIPPDFSRFHPMPDATTQEESVLTFVDKVMRDRSSGDMLSWMKPFLFLFAKPPTGADGDSDIRVSTDPAAAPTTVNIKTETNPSVYRRAFGGPVDAGQNVFLSVTAGPNANNNFRTTDLYRAPMMGKQDTMFRSLSLPASQDYGLFRRMVQEALVGSLTLMATQKVTTAICAPLSCGIYAGNHKPRIKLEIVTLTMEAVESVQTSTGHHFEEIIMFNPAPAARSAFTDLAVL